MSSTALQLVNKILVLTGDYQKLVTIAGAPADIGERIVHFLNEAISDIDSQANWPQLRLSVTGTGDGVNDTFEFGGTEDVRFDGAISVWIPNVGKLVELPPQEFDRVKAENVIRGNPIYFLRGVSPTGKLQIQFYPIPSNGQTLNVTAYRRATKLDPAIDTSVTEFDDELLIYGAMAHMDAFDGMDRGYGPMFQKALYDAVFKTYLNTEYRRNAESYK